MNKQTKELRTADSVLAVIVLQLENTIPENALWRAFCLLSKEYPGDFPDLFFRNTNGIPYSSELEGILFQLGAWRIVTQADWDYIITDEIKTSCRKELEKIYTEEMKHFALLAQRFAELIKSDDKG